MNRTGSPDAAEISAAASANVTSRGPPPQVLVHPDERCSTLYGEDLTLAWDRGVRTWLGVSRAALARRFTELVGEPPMAYLTAWRLALAADLLREPDATLGAVAHQVGYGSPFALSAAFKRVRGMSPQEFRAAAQPVPV